MTDTIDDALARAQARFGAVKKTKTNPHFKSKYAGLDDVLAAVLPALNAEGITLLQPLRVDEQGNTVLVTQLRWKGEAIESVVPFDMHGKPPEIGSALTYFRRYWASALLGLASEDDDDGNAAQERSPRPTPAVVAAPAPVEVPVEVTEFRDAVKALCKERKLTGSNQIASVGAAVMKYASGRLVTNAADLSLAEAAKGVEAVNAIRGTQLELVSYGATGYVVHIPGEEPFGLDGD